MKHELQIKAANLLAAAQKISEFQDRMSVLEMAVIETILDESASQQNARLLLMAHINVLMEAGSKAINEQYSQRAARMVM
jgi:hypothetical protein